VTEVTHIRWRPEYGGLKLDQVKRLRANPIWKSSDLTASAGAWPFHALTFKLDNLMGASARRR